MTLNFGDFVKTESGDVFRVIHTESVTNDGIDVRTVDRYGGSDWVSSTKLTPLPDYVDFDGPKKQFYKHRDGFKSGTKFISRVGDSWTTDGNDHKCRWSYSENEVVAYGYWVEITEAEAMALLEPKYVPWTFETMPIVKTYFKEHPELQRLAIPCNCDLIQIGEGYDTYQFLFDNYVTLDGSPCGELKNYE